MLTRPGAAFELVTEEVRGIPMQVYKHRMPTLRTAASLGLARGDDQPCLVYGDRRIGFARCVESANAVSANLEAVGVGPGDRVAVLSANNPEWVYAFWGTVDLGAVLVGLNGWWKADEILYGLADSGARVLFADPDRFARIADRLDDLPDVEAVYLIGAWPGSSVGSSRRVRPFEELLEPVGGAGMPDTAISEDDPAVIFYTSGTTGRPKGAISTHRSMIANLQNTFYNHTVSMMVGGTMPGGGSGGQTTSLLTSPLFHVSGCHSGIVIAMAAGVKTVMTAGRFDPEESLRLIEQEKVSVWAAVPSVVARAVAFADRHRYDLSSVTTIAYGGSSPGIRLQQQVRETFPNVRTIGNAYGLTESSSVVTVNTGQDYLDRPDSVGRAVPGIEIRVVGPAGEELGVGERGEIWLKGALITPGYWGKPDDTARAVTDGWLHTGDIGYLDDGFLYITDRAKDMIIRGGENVYSVEIENRLLEHPAIADAAVIGVAHPILGEEVKAVVTVVAGRTVAVGQLRAWVAETLADFKVPAYIEIRDQPLPRNATGKLLKNALRGEGTVSFAETL